jgi:thiol-disulfide isomerase/thioredoxin
MARRFGLRTSSILSWIGVLLVGVAFALAADDDEPAAEGNPYLPREGMNAEELRDFIERMHDAPRTVQLQPGFTEGIEVAVDRLLAAKPSDELKAFGIRHKMDVLHKPAAYENDEKAQKKLVELAKEGKALLDKGLKDKELARSTEFYLLEHRLIDGADNAKTEDLPALLDESKKFFAAEEDLGQKHLRMSSATVKVINRVAEDELAEKSYKEFGELWAKSFDLDLKRYGQRIAKGTRKKTPPIVGKQMEFAGTTVDDKPFNIEQLRGKVVLVQFWATWCGPCMASLSGLQKIYDEHHPAGFEIVALSQDDDKQALDMALDEYDLPWVHIWDRDQKDAEKHPIADTYGAHALPTTFLLDKTGKVVAKDLEGKELTAAIEKLIEANGASDGKADGSDAKDVK